MKLAGGGQANVETGSNFGIGPPSVIKGCLRISSRVSLFSGSTTKSLEIRLLAFVEIYANSGKLKLAALILL